MKLAKIDKSDSFTIFGTINKNMINYFKPPYAIRNDCQIGQWKTGKSSFLGDYLEIAIIGMKNFYGTLGKTKDTSWLQIFFVGSPKETKLPINTVCVTYTKTQSLSSLGQKAIEIMGNTDPGFGIFSTSFEKHTNVLGDYFSVDWNWRERGEDEFLQLALIKEFLLTNPELEDSRLPNTMIPLDNITLEEAQIKLAILEG